MRKPLSTSSRLDAGSESLGLESVVLDSSLLGSSILSESGRSTEGASWGVVLDLDDADVLGTTDFSGTLHTRGHLDGDGEVSVGRSAETSKTKAWNVLNHLSGLEGASISSSGAGIDLCGERTSTILVNLKKPLAYRC